MILNKEAQLTVVFIGVYVLNLLVTGIRGTKCSCLGRDKYGIVLVNRILCLSLYLCSAARC